MLSAADDAQCAATLNTPSSRINTTIGVKARKTDAIVIGQKSQSSGIS